jgi:hypothetical protein
MTYRIAGIDVHKRMLAVVIADVAVEGEYRFERRKVGTCHWRILKSRSNRRLVQPATVFLPTI